MRREDRSKWREGVERFSLLSEKCVKKWQVMNVRRSVVVLCLSQVIDVPIVSLNDPFAWKGHGSLPVKDDVQCSAGFQPCCVVQVHPPMPVTALAVADNWKL